MHSTTFLLLPKTKNSGNSPKDKKFWSKKVFKEPHHFICIPSNATAKYTFIKHCKFSLGLKRNAELFERFIPERDNFEPAVGRKRPAGYRENLWSSYFLQDLINSLQLVKKATTKATIFIIASDFSWAEIAETRFCIHFP